MKNDELEILKHLIRDLETFPVRTCISHDELNQLLETYDEINKKRRSAMIPGVLYSSLRSRN